MTCALHTKPWIYSSVFHHAEVSELPSVRPCALHRVIFASEQTTLQRSAGKLSMAEQQRCSVWSEARESITLGVNPRSAMYYLYDTGPYTKYVAFCASGWSSVRWR